MVGKRAPTIDRFWSKVARGADDQCWEWLGHANGANYGMIWSWEAKRKVLAHRLSYKIHYGIDPGTQLVCHKCDNPRCVNPHHLFLGDHRANTLDMYSKGRHPKPSPKRNPDGSLVNPPPIFTGDDHFSRRRPELVRKGEDIGTSKLTEAQVSEIYRRRMSGEAVRSIARVFDMDRATIGDICTGERWTHLLGVNGNPTKDQLLALPPARQPTLLSEDIVRSIRADFASGMMGIEVAKKYGVTKQTASEIRTRKTWAHVV